MTDSMRYAWRRLVVRDPDLSDATRRVLLELESYADPDGTNAHPGIMRIAEQLRTPTGKAQHVSERTVRTALATGVDRGFIELTRKAPRGRGNRFSDVYRLTFPLECETGIPETQTAGIPAEKVEVQTAGNALRNTGSLSGITGNQDLYYRQSGLPTTSPSTPEPFTPERVVT
ncbi:hypothetical protein [Rhodococcus opacus]|uniref:hypothetical protein n=1 Tax=Rhodococcus opacus TaxID=37919 RepID=UPI0024BB7200|nr:hypothetical protein [Rhodococcus opacus]MDJ0413824.1 hypothetical protein [Rhodococcus opacus]